MRRVNSVIQKLWIWSHLLKKSLMKNFIFAECNHIMHKHCILIISEEIWTFFIPPFSIQIVFCLILAHASFHINSSIISWGTVVKRARCITADIASVSKMIIYPTTLHRMSENTGFQWPIFSRIRTESSTILSLYGRIRVSENRYSCIFCTVQ